MRFCNSAMEQFCKIAIMPIFPGLRYLRDMMCSLSMAKQEYSERKKAQAHGEKVEESGLRLKKPEWCTYIRVQALLPRMCVWEGDGI